MSKATKNTTKTTFFVACAILLTALFATLVLPALVSAAEAKPVVACAKVYKEGRISQMFAGDCVYMTSIAFGADSASTSGFLVKLTDLKLPDQKTGVGGVAAFQIFDENGKLVDSPAVGAEKGYDQNGVLVSVYKIFSGSDQFAAASAQPYADVYVSIKPVATVVPTLKPTPTTTVVPIPAPLCSMIYKEGKIFSLYVGECVKTAPTFSAANANEEKLVKLSKIYSPPVDCDLALGTECKAPAVATFEIMLPDGKALTTVALKAGDSYQANNVLIQLNSILPFASAEKQGAVDALIVYYAPVSPTTVPSCDQKCVSLGYATGKCASLNTLSQADTAPDFCASVGGGLDIGNKGDCPSPAALGYATHCCCQKGVAPTVIPTVTVQPTATVVPSPTLGTPGQSECDFQRVLRVGDSFVSCERLVFKATEMYPTIKGNDWDAFWFTVQGTKFVLNPGNRATIVTSEGGPALWIKLSNNGGEYGMDFATATVKSFEKFYKQMNVGAVAKLRDGTVIELVKVAAESEAVGNAVFRVTPPGEASKEVTTEPSVELAIGKTKIYLLNVGKNSDYAMVGFGTTIPATTDPGAVYDQPGGIWPGECRPAVNCKPTGVAPRAGEVVTLYRIVRRCGTNKMVGDAQVIPTIQTGYYGSCNSWENSQCYDGSFDAYYDEKCDYAGGTQAGTQSGVTPSGAQVSIMNQNNAMWSFGCQAYMPFPLNKVTQFTRIIRSCATDEAVAEPQIIYPNGGYCNFKCQSRKQEQCYEDGTFDNYYDESYCGFDSNLTIEPPVPKPIGLPTVISAPVGKTYKIYLNAGWNMFSTPLIQIWAYNPKLAQTVTAVDALIAEKMKEKKQQEKELQAVAVSAETERGKEQKGKELMSVTGAVTAASSTSATISEATQVVEAMDFMQIGDKYAFPDGKTVVLKDAAEEPMHAKFILYGVKGDELDVFTLEASNPVYDKNSVVIHLGRVFAGASGVVYVQAKFSSMQAMQTAVSSASQSEAKKKKEQEAQAIAGSTQVMQTGTDVVQVGAVNLVQQEAAFVNLPLTAVSAGGRIYETDCKPMTIFSYDANKRQYDSPGFIAPGTMLAPQTGYWAYAPNACSITIEGTEEVSLEGARLHTGWNLVGGPLSLVSFDSMLGNCEVLGGPWYYNSAKSAYEKASVLEAGKAYFVRVKSTCTLGSVSAEIPSPPEMPGFPEWVETASS